MTADALTGRGTARRAALLGLAGAAAWPVISRAQTAVPGVNPTLPPAIAPPAAPTTAPSPAPSLAPSPAPTPAFPSVAPPAASVAPRPANAAIDGTKAYYVFFNQTIDYPTMLTMRRQLTTLVEAGVAEITLVITSGGGLVEPALLTYSFIRALPARINTHGQGLVASAANILFLAGQQRSADRSARFLFHPSTYVLSGALTDEQIHDRIDATDNISKIVTDIYHERTALTEQDIAKFTRGQVIYDANEARTLGIVQTVADLRIPGGQKARILFLE